MGMAKKKSSTKHISTTDTHIMLKKSLFVYAGLVFITFILVSLSWFTIHQLVESRVNNQRKEQILTIYDSLHLGDKYNEVRYNVFGDKRVYVWDDNRTSSSSIEYTRSDTPQNTLADLKQRIEAAGFSPAGSAYVGSPSPQYYYKNDAGNYIRVQVTSKYVQDATMYRLDTAADPLLNHKDEAPTYVTIKVNLDDNNE